MKMKLSRREILGVGSVAGCAAIGGSILKGANFATASPSAAALPWSWKKIDPAEIQERAYQSAWEKIGCMYGVCEAILGTLADRYGAPYNTFPVDATVYGSGGIGGIGAVCGTINASGLLFNLFVKDQNDLFALCSEMSLWYEKASLPNYKPKKPKVDIQIAKSVAGSNLCHVSSTNWANASGYKVMTNEHFERCNRLVADVAVQLVTVLNQYTAGNMTFKEKLNDFSLQCLSCHGPGNSEANVAAGMTCNPCHENPH
ncbi:MAG: C-GCAxxG-C-C family protein [Acidobacteria bacterium]|nr:C-GCAxxG-C-C family protein [Acidobacteriota bacterium]